MMAVGVDPARIDEVWPYYGHYIKSACDKVGLITAELIYKDLLIGSQLMWLAYDGNEVLAACTTHLVGGACEVTACGGKNLKAFLPLIADLEQFARDEGCTKFRVIGRAGWSRVLEKYKTKAIILERSL